MQFDLFGNTPEQKKAKSAPASKAKAAPTAVTRVKIPIPDPPPKPTLYGLCKCGELFSAPGLDASLCSSCGYRVDAQWLSARPQTAKKGGAS
jgi:hypothetical protein